MKAIVGHVCFYCHHVFDQTKDNPARTDLCVKCGHRGEGIKRTLEKLDWGILHVVPNNDWRSEMNVQFEYALGEPVKIKALEMIGHIDSLELDNNGKMYRVIYWFNGERKSAWSYGYELESTRSQGVKK